MKNKLYWLLVLISGIIFFTSCKKNITETGNTDSVLLHNCSGKVSPYICFDSVVQDSRCPKGAECIWSGTAIINIRFYETGNNHNFKMSLRGFPGLGFPSDTTINGFRIIFTDLQPYPDFNSPLPGAKDIKAFFILTN